MQPLNPTSPHADRKTPASHLEIGGFTPLTTIDFPGHLAAVVFCQGCPWRCRYCQNAHLIPRAAEDPVNWHRLLEFLERRVGLLDGVVFSGGEPTLQAALPDAIQSLKSLGYQIGLHTAGPYPTRLRRVLPLLDWVGFDIKALIDDYAAVTGVPASGEKVLQSAELVLSSGVECEFRTTVHPDLLDETALRSLARRLAQMGVQNYMLQECISEHCLDEGLRCAPAKARLGPGIVEELGALFPRFSVRYAGAAGRGVRS